MYTNSFSDIHTDNITAKKKLLLYTNYKTAYFRRNKLDVHMHPHLHCSACTANWSINE